MGHRVFANTVLLITVSLMVLCTHACDAGEQEAQRAAAKPAQREKPKEAVEGNAESTDGIIEERDQPESSEPEEATEKSAKPTKGIMEKQAPPEANVQRVAAEDATDVKAAHEGVEGVTERGDKAAEAETSTVKEPPTESLDFSGGWGQPERKAPPASKPGHVTNFFFDTPIREALSEMATQTGEIIVPDASVQGLVTCDLKEVPLEKALNIVLSIGNLVWRRMDGFIFVGSPDSESSSFSVFSETQRVKMNYIKAQEAVVMLLKPMQKYASANATSNTVSVTAPPSLLERIVSDLRLFDQPSRHVMLDARVVAMQRQDLLNLGVQWDWPTISAGIFSGSEYHGGGSEERVQWPWGIQIGYTPGQEFTNSLQLTLNLLTQNDEATVTASPQLIAQDGQESQIKVATEEYFKITQESAYYTRFELETIETGTTLTITPRIGDNNEITLEISTEVSDVIARGEDNLPVVTRRTTKNTVRLEDGGTAAIAGLIDNRTRLQKQRAPGLAGIPIFGQLFRNSAGYKSSRQVAVFVTARLMPEEGLLRQQLVEERTPIEPVGEEFRAALQEALSTLSTGNRKP